jgi:hypothetical protein
MAQNSIICVVNSFGFKSDVFAYVGFNAAPGKKLAAEKRANLGSYYIV